MKYKLVSNPPSTGYHNIIIYDHSQATNFTKIHDPAHINVML